MSGKATHQLAISSFSAKDLQVLYEDNHLIAVFKPPGVLTQGDATENESLMDVVKSWLRQAYQKPGNVFLGLVHRLDREVAGVVLFAKTSKGASRLSEQFRSRRVRKTYRAWVEGELNEPLRLVNYLSVEANPRVKVSDTPGEGLKLAALSFCKLGERAGNTFIEIELETGRKHQIRAQLAHFGHPILGDFRYGASQPWPPGGIALVAHGLEFSHPTRPEERVAIRCPLERDTLGQGLLHDRG